MSRLYTDNHQTVGAGASYKTLTILPYPKVSPLMAVKYRTGSFESGHRRLLFFGLMSMIHNGETVYIYVNTNINYIVAISILMTH